MAADFFRNLLMSFLLFLLLYCSLPLLLRLLLIIFHLDMITLSQKSEGDGCRQQKSRQARQRSRSAFTCKINKSECRRESMYNSRTETSLINVCISRCCVSVSESDVAQNNNNNTQPTATFQDADARAAVSLEMDVKPN